MVNDFEQRIKALEKEVKNLRNPVIGKVYIRNIPGIRCEFCIDWVDVCRNEIIDKVDGNIKIEFPNFVSFWVKEFNVVFYNNIDKQKMAVEKRLQK